MPAIAHLCTCMEGNGVVSVFTNEVCTKINTGLVSLSASSSIQSRSLSGFPPRQTTCSCLHDLFSLHHPTPLFLFLVILIISPNSHVNACASIQGGGQPRTGKAAWRESRIILSAAILVYRNRRRMASDWHNWLPFQTPQSKACISPFVSKATCSLPPLPNLHARCSWLARPVTPWVATSGNRRHRGGEKQRYHPAEGKQNYQAWRSPTRPPPPFFHSSLMSSPCSLMWFQYGFPVVAIKTNCNSIYKIRIGAYVQTCPSTFP